MDRLAESKSISQGDRHRDVIEPSADFGGVHEQGIMAARVA
jgi:hypothetical protein